jgi:hypothetical protein
MRNEAAKQEVADANINESPEQVAPAPELTAVEKGELAKQETARVKTNEQIRLEQARAKLSQKAREKSKEIETYSIPASQDPLKEQKDQLRKSFETQDSAGRVSNNPLENSLNRDLDTIDYISKKTGENMHDFYRERNQIIEDLDAKQEALRQPPTTADSYGQDYVPNQSAVNLVDRSIDLGSEMADESPTVASELSQSQDSQPYDSKLGFQEDPMAEKKLPDVTELLGKVPSQKKVAAFFTRLGLDDALAGAGGLRNEPVELIGDDSPLNDNVDSELDGGEDQSGVPTQKNLKARGQNTSATTDLSAHHKEMRRMNAMDRNKKAIDEIVEKAPTPSEKQVGKSPNELAGKDQETFLALTGNPSQQRRIEADQARSRVEQKTAYKQRMAGMQTPLTEQYYPTDVARTDIQVGGMVDRKTGLGKSVGISRTPLNGDTKIGFNIMNDPTKPTEVATFDFIAPPDTMESLESRKEGDLGSMSVGKLFNIARQRKQGFQGV